MPVNAEKIKFMNKHDIWSALSVDKIVVFIQYDKILNSFDDKLEAGEKIAIDLGFEKEDLNDETLDLLVEIGLSEFAMKEFTLRNKALDFLDKFITQTEVDSPYYVCLYEDTELIEDNRVDYYET